MRARNLKFPILLLAGTLVLTLGAGCGNRVGSLVDPAEEPASPPAKETPAPAPSTPAPQPTPPQIGNPFQPGNPSMPGNPSAQLQAVIEEVKNGSFFGMGTLMVKVKVSNPTPYALSGEVTVSFTNGGKPTTHVASDRVSLSPNEYVYKYFENGKWVLDGATVTVKTDAPLANTSNPYGY